MYLNWIFLSHGFFFINSGIPPIYVLALLLTHVDQILFSLVGTRVPFKEQD